MKKTYIIPFSVALVICLILAISCTPDSKPIETEPELIGFITEIHPGQNEDISGRISVESHAEKIVTKYIITVKSETLIFQQDGENLRKADFAKLAANQWVKIWFSGPVMESWPLQGTAKQVVISE